MEAFQDQLALDHQELLEILTNYSIPIPSFQEIALGANGEGEIFTMAYPIQGLLKYHGLSDPLQRIAYFPSISLCNDAIMTITYCKFSPQRDHDTFIINGKPSEGKETTRLQEFVDLFRQQYSISSKLLMISRNIDKKTQHIVNGKGLGTSASAGAALTQALFGIAFPDVEILQQKPRLLSTFARSFAGSAARSVVGGIGLWFNYPGINPIDSFAIRLDSQLDRDFISSINLISIPISSKVLTDEAHHIAPLSPFFRQWALDRQKQINLFLQALKQHDFDHLGQLSEYDTLCLHAITMTATMDKNLILFSTETIQLINLTRELRSEGFHVYFSIDTGPSVVFLTLSHETSMIVSRISQIIPELPILIGKIGGPSLVLADDASEKQILAPDIEQFGDD